MVVILAIACMGLNLLVGYTGLDIVRPRRLVRHRRLRRRPPAEALLPRPDRHPDHAGDAFRRRRVGVRRPHHPAPARRVLLAADAGAGGAHLHHRLPLDRGDRRRGRPRRTGARPRRPLQPRRSARLLHHGGAGRAWRPVRAAARDAFAVRARAGGDPREPAARHLPGLSRRPLQARGIRAVGSGDEPRRRAARLPDLPRLGGGRLRALLRRAAGDRGDRRHASHPGPGARCAVLHPVPRDVLDLDRQLAALVRPGIRRLRHLLAGRPGRHLDQAAPALPAAAGRGRRHEPAQDLRGPAPAGLPRAGDPAGNACSRSTASPRTSAASAPCRTRASPCRRSDPRTDRSQRRRQDDACSTSSRACSRPSRGRVRLYGKPIHRLPSHRICQQGIARSFQITNLFRGLSIYENLRLSLQAKHPGRFNVWRDIDSYPRRARRDGRADQVPRPRRHRGDRGRRALLRRPAAGRPRHRARLQAAGAAAGRAAGRPRRRGARARVQPRQERGGATSPC